MAGDDLHGRVLAVRRVHGSRNKGAHVMWQLTRLRAVVGLAMHDVVIECAIDRSCW